MELKEISRGYLRVQNGAKSITVYGEALLRGYGPSDFVLYQNSIEKWDVSDIQEDVTPAEKKQLIQFLKEEFARKKMILEIE
ncbi:Imm74 family immunity protein [Massilia sp. YIM B02443]|uniref:Imm74 family immunity protein n=1 Tax=Massilia sp. YIM B02443 TaxID=3050127 RepID=UPI0025B6BE11|nr:Imm74 family immunity protein [Massilia sp. YIM B02443]MDN4038735.1 Imm74 family immunity protein [Massilia sp. YIM B02443]